jgi:hypothetical protein
MTMDTSDFFPSKFLKAADIGKSALILTIQSVGSETLGQGADTAQKLIVGFKERKQGLVLNKTNYMTLVNLTGSRDTDHWIGKRVKLVAVRVDFQGRRVAAIRIDPASAPTVDTNPDDDDDPDVGF